MGALVFELVEGGARSVGVFGAFSTVLTGALAFVFVGDTIFRADWVDLDFSRASHAEGFNAFR